MAPNITSSWSYIHMWVAILILMMLFICSACIWSYYNSIHYDNIYAKMDMTFERIHMRLKTMNDKHFENWNRLDARIDYISGLEWEYVKKQEPPLKNNINFDNLVPVSVTAYNMGTYTSTDKKVVSGMIACSSDLIKKWGYGETIGLFIKESDNYFKYGEYILDDKMHDRMKMSCDIYMTSHKSADEFGRKKMWAIKIEKSK